MLVNDTTIHTLRLCQTNIGNAGAKDLATMLEKNTSLHTLDLTDHDIGDDGIEAFEHMLEKNFTIQYIELDFGEYYDSTTMPPVEAAVEDALDRNRNDSAALRHAVNFNNIQAIELLLEKHHENLKIQKELVVRIGNVVSQTIGFQNKPL